MFRTINLVGLLFAAIPSTKGCGPYYPLIPTPDFFADAYQEDAYRDYDRDENLVLWQRLTSDRIPLSDIEKAVYKDSYDKASHVLYGMKDTDNLFYVYLTNTDDREIIDFLMMAKCLEERRGKMCSPWYYPATRGYGEGDGDFYDIIEKCINYKGTRLKDRYGLQAVRAYFAQHDYENCISFYEDFYADFPDDNLFKRMSMKYVAGCWSRLGDDDRANLLYAKAGEYGGHVCEKGTMLLAEINPDSPDLIRHVKYCSKDSARFCSLAPVMEKVLSDGKTKNRGDWEFALAYMDGEYKNDYRSASHHIARALKAGFSSEHFKDKARAYRSKIDAKLGRKENLLADLRWFEEKTDKLSPQAIEWERALQNVVFTGWVPKLWKKGDYATAILLCSFAENIIHSYQKYAVGPRNFWEWQTPVVCGTLDEMRKDENCFNEVDFCSLSFQLMGSLTSSQLIEVKNRIKSGGALYSYLKKYARTDDAYYDELIGTLAIREENYKRAMNFLAKVPLSYQKTMNLYKGGYFDRDPLYLYPSRWYTYSSGNCEYESKTEGKKGFGQENAKYRFAKQMDEYQRAMKYGRTADERGLARLRYAIGRRNSFEECWALTQYWRGSVYRFIPALNYWNDEYNDYDFVYDYETSVGHKETERIYNEEIKAALAMLTTDEARAEAQYLLGNLVTVVRLYADTETGRFVKSSCDNWKQWL